MKDFQENFECFFDVATCGDIISIYRGRPIWANYHPDKLVIPAEILFNNVPSARGAVLHYIAKLVHETVHLYFSEKERKEGTGKGVDYTNLETSVKQLISTLNSFKGEIKTKTTSSFPLLLLQWLFELCADLSHQNHNRPYFNLQRHIGGQQSSTQCLIRGSSSSTSFGQSPPLDNKIPKKVLVDWRSCSIDSSSSGRGGSSAMSSADALLNGNEEEEEEKGGEMGKEKNY
uniref:Integrator complex subunit 5 N-terminal domain-containing protein n=1 Tax=Meloidogyne enterolobii TaxID=390850 RepID=A0A6V7TSS2_MELEN|nr:unnamed protein product [Meloidogyne enterolobii]